MNRGFAYIDEYPKCPLRIATRKQRLAAINVMAVYLERISNAERRQMGRARRPSATAWRCEAELIASVVDEAVFILEMLQYTGGGE